MKKRAAAVVSLCLIAAAFFLFRGMLSSMPELKSLPLFLLLAGAAVIAVSGLIRGRSIASVFTAAGYILGFFYAFAVVRFFPDLGSAADTMFQTWVGAFATTVIAGILIEIFKARRDRYI